MGQIVDDRFELRSLVTSGGMGAVYRAVDLGTGLPVAVKLLTCGNTNWPRFTREARLLSELEHPSIVRYIAHGFAQSGVPYLAMEWLEGEDLARLLARRGPRPVDEALSWIRQAAEALGVAHRRGVIHRDIKPSNLFVLAGQGARIKVLDFGVARGSESERLTTTGTVVGTPAYMAPEQARGDDDIAPSADVYALGCVLYECLTGRRAFSGEHVMGVLAKILVGPTPRLGALRPDVSPALDALLTAMLAKEPQARPADAAALLECISALPGDARASGSQGSAPPAAISREKSLFCVLMIGAQRRNDVSGVADQSPDTAWQLRSIAVRHDARLEFLREGSALLLFEGEGAANDLAAQAASCALKLSPLFPGMPMAIATGLGFTASASGDVIDRAAALLQGQATETGPSSESSTKVMLDSVTAGLIESRFELDRDASGNATLTRVKRDRSAPRTLLGKVTPCVGREREIGTLQALFLECVRDAAARAVLITAAAGVGKSRLCQEFLARQRAATPAFQLWRAWGDPTRAGARFGLLKQAARATLRISERDSLAAAIQKLRARMASRLPADQARRVSEFLGELVGVPFPEQDSVQLRAARQDSRLMGEQITRAWIDWVAAECAQRPVLLVLDDVHWADSSSLQLIDATLRSAPKVPFFVLGLGRRETHERFPGLWKDRALEQSHLSGLSTAACEALARSVLPDHVADDTVARIVEHCAGNAFFLEELLRAHVEGHGAESPGTVLAMLHARLVRLPAAARRLLLAASVFGQSFWSGALEHVLPSHDVEKPTAELLEVLLERDWVTLAGTTRFAHHTEFSFRHALIREAAYALLDEDERRDTHRAAAEWLETAGELDAAVFAKHWELGGEFARASECFRAAAQQCLASDDMNTSLAHAERAIALGANGLALAEVRLLQAEAHNWRAEHQAARERALEAIEGFEAFATHADDERWAYAIQHAAWACERQARPDEVEHFARLLLGRARSDVKPKVLIALTYTVLNSMLVGRMAVATEIVTFLDAVAGPIVASDPSAAAVVELIRGHYAAATSNPGESLRHYERAAARTHEVGNTRLMIEAHVALAGAREVVGEYELALQSLELVEAQGSASAHVFTITANLALVDMRLGKTREAEALLRTRISVGSEQVSRTVQCYDRVCLARVLLERRRFVDAEHEARAALDVSENFPTGEAYAAAVLAAALLAQDRAAEAVSAAARAQVIVEGGGVLDGEAFIRLSYAEALLGSGSLEAGRQALRAAAEKVQDRALRLDDPELRHKFLTRVSEHVRTLELARRYDAEGQTT